MLTQEVLKKHINYDPDKGIFTWIEPTCKKHKKGDLAGGLDNSGYIRIRVFGTKYLAHRLAFLYIKGYMPDYVDHKDCDHLNLKWDNLREATSSENNQNRSMMSNNTSGYKGVSFFKPRNNWRARITVKGEVHLVGYYESPEAANSAIIKYREKLHGEFANHG